MDVLETLQKLPEVCYTYNNVTGELIAIKRGVMGYFKVPGGKRFSAEALNEGIATVRQVLAMEIGSLVGWEVPGADPDNAIYTDERCAKKLDWLREYAAKLGVAA